MSRAEFGWLRIGRWRVAYRDNRARGPAFVFIHGNSSSLRSFERQFEDPQLKGHRLIAIDLPGHGNSVCVGQGRNKFSIPMFARTITEAARRLRVRDGIFVGHSLGGHFLLQAHRGLGPRQRIVILGTSPLRNPPDFGAAYPPSASSALILEARRLIASEVAAWGQSGFKGAPPIRFAEDVNRADPGIRGGLARALMSLRFRDEWEVMRDAKPKIAVIHGEEDEVVPIAYLQTLPREWIWREQIQVIPGVGHNPHWEDPTAFGKVLKNLQENL